MKEYKEDYADELKELNRIIESLEFDARNTKSVKSRKQLTDKYRAKLAQRNNLKEKISNLPSKKLEEYAKEMNSEKPEEQSEEVRSLLHSAYKYGDNKTRTNKDILFTNAAMMYMRHKGDIPFVENEVENEVISTAYKFAEDRYRGRFSEYFVKKLKAAAEKYAEHKRIVPITEKSADVSEYETKPQTLIHHEFSDDDMNRIFTACLFVDKPTRKRIPSRNQMAIVFMTIKGEKCVYGTNGKILYVSLLDYPDALEKLGVSIYDTYDFVEELKKSETLITDGKYLYANDKKFELWDDLYRVHVPEVIPNAGDKIQSVTISETAIKSFSKIKKKDLEDEFIRFRNNLVSYGDKNEIVDRIEEPFMLIGELFLKGWKYIKPETLDVYRWNRACMSGESEFVVIATVIEKE